MKWFVGIFFLLTGCHWFQADDARLGEREGSLLKEAQPLESESLVMPALAEDLDPDADVVRVSLTAAPYSYQVGDQTISGFAYNGQVPGPTIHAKRGDRLVVEFHNELETATTVHWHGMHVPIEMDGVTWQRDPIQPGQSFTYEFDLNQSGTYWYHPHFDTQRMVDLGLYGAIIIQDPAEPEVDEDVLLVLDNWSENEDREGLHNHGTVDGKLRQWTVNNQIQPTLNLAGGSVVRVRIVNVSNGGYANLRWPEMEIIGGDQGLLAALATPESVLLGAGDRVEAIVRVGGEGFAVETLPYTVLGGSAYGDPGELMQVGVTEPGNQAPMPAFSFTHERPTEVLNHSDVVYVLQGDSQQGIWLMNAEVFPDITIEEITLGEAAVIEVRNLSPGEHPFHLHGYGFEVLSLNGIAPEYQMVEDTINLKIYETVRLRIIATNPGDWMAHCHILAHQGSGMMTVLRVH